MKLTLTEIESMSGGRLLAAGIGGCIVEAFVTDSREAKPGTMFVPVQGERVDGHQYIDKALEAGAICSFTGRPPEKPSRVMLVDDCRAALQRVGEAYRQRFDIPIVGVTGSVGKTTAKEMAAQALTARHNVYRTPGNKNSQVGVPITICGIEPEHTAAVIEMGVSMPGEMERIARVVKPTCGIITTIGASHIEFMRSRENILREKVHMAGYLPEGAPLFVSGDNDLLPGLSGAGLPYRVATFGLGENCDWRGTDIVENGESLEFTCASPEGSVRVWLPVLGEHNVRNALAAMALGAYLGQGLEETAKALRDYAPPEMRQRTVKRGGVLIIDDSYNASPDSMCAAMDVLASRQVSGRKIAVLAGMRELGDFSHKGHLDTGSYAKEKDLELITVGELGREIAEGYGSGARTVEDNAAAVELLREELRPGDAVLIKGSRGMKTEEIVEGLLASLPEGDEA